MHRYSWPKRRRGPLPPVRWPYGSHRPIYKGRLKGTAWLFRPVGTADHLPYIARPYGYDLPCMWGRWMHIYGNQTKSRLKILYVFSKRTVEFGTLLEHYVLRLYLPVDFPHSQQLRKTVQIQPKQLPCISAIWNGYPLKMDGGRSGRTGTSTYIRLS